MIEDPKEVGKGNGKGDDDSPNYRSRMVGKEFNNGEFEGLFAATPRLEALMLILS